MGILSAAVFLVHSTVNPLKGYDQCQLVFGIEMALPIKHTANCKSIPLRNQEQINYDDIHKKKQIITRLPSRI